MALTVRFHMSVASIMKLPELSSEVRPFIVKIDIESFEENLFSKNVEWVASFPIIIIELHDWMIDKRGSSRTFYRTISQYDRDFFFKGENVFSLSRELPPLKDGKFLTRFDLFIAGLLKRYLTRYPVLRTARHSELSIINSVDDDVRPNDFLLDLSLLSAQDSRRVSLADLAAQKEHLPDAVYYDVYPGSHYRLLKILARNLAKNNIVEVGTFTGMSSLCTLRGMQASCKLTTFDLVSWRQFRSHADTGRPVQSCGLQKAPWISSLTPS